MRCAVISHIPSGQTYYFPCSSMEGRYVTVFLPGSENVLSICEVEVYYGYPLPNVALKGEATQSSTLSFATASKAIDGRRNSFYSNGFCSHTAEDETNPWWRVDLQRSFTITAVKVTNRGDCCAERLDGAEIRIGNSLENNGNNNPRCASISHIKVGKTYTYRCDGGSMEGRFVNVFLPGQKKTLTLCEVEVYAAPAVEPLQNVALNKQTVQSSTGNAVGIPFKGVDGCRTEFWGYSCCTHTGTQQNPWWRVDLLAVYKVTAVTIINRQDCCSERLLGAQILIGDSLEQNGNTNSRCGVLESLAGTPTYTFQCNEMKGRYISVIIPGSPKILTLCEVEVFASLPAPEAVIPSPTPPPPSSPPPTVSLQLGGRNVTVVGERLCWSDALMHCRRYYWDLLSLHSQQEQSELEQLLGLVPFSLTDHVWLGLRRSLRADEWFWMSGYSMNFLNWPQDFVPDSYSSTCGGVASTDHFLWQDQPCGENLNFICQSGFTYTTLKLVRYYRTLP
uniref:C-type lectin domain-containing protein n=1 Tax=Astatotilapia calliptera TaxID=8154 RepID=A0A3P8N903_ASTCA